MIEPEPETATYGVVSVSPDQTIRLGRLLGEILPPGSFVALVGGLGAGKTLLPKGLAGGLGVEDEGEVSSPTFVLVGVYRTAPGRPPLYHLDLYRISGPQEALDFGLEDYLYGEGVVAIEWAERIREILPPEYLWITFRHLDATKRGLVMQPKGARYEALVADLMRDIYGGKD